MNSLPFFSEPQANYSELRYLQGNSFLAFISGQFRKCQAVWTKKLLIFCHLKSFGSYDVIS